LIGQKLAHYEITELLGKGGMGEVYRARDTKLHREVALKILPRELSGDPERAARFEREARTLASLQHPNIASIYGYENVDGVRFLSMELVEGPDLSQRLQNEKFSVDQVLRIARQIALGLEAAHEKNIVHRDLKPANIKVDPDGVVKILDFGLARAYAGDPENQQLENSPTITSANTQLGVILGTAAYMSPEQARGKAIDKRSDIWSFGVILSELLTGRPMYHGETVTDVLGAIVHSAPDIKSLPGNTPSGLRTLISRCLTSDVHDRLRDIGEARYALHHLDSDGTAASESHKRSSRPWMLASLILLLGVLGLGAKVLLAPKAEIPILQASVALPAGHLILTTGPRGGSVRMSPDGRAVAFVAQGDNKQQIWVRNLDERVARPVPGTENGHRPFWSPDGQSLGFFADGKLRRISIRGGAALTITSAPEGRGAVWLTDGTILFAPNPSTTISAVAAGGGEPRVVTSSDKPDREPRALPDGRHFIYLEDHGGGQWQIKVGSLDGGTDINVGLTSGGVEYALGRLLYLQNRTLVAQPFDAKTFQLTGEPSPVAEDILRDANFGIGVFSTSENGVLAFQSGGSAGAQLQWIDRQGQVLGEIGERLAYNEIALSPDGKTIATVIDELDGQNDIWMINVDSGLRKRFTFTADTDKIKRGDPTWSPDGRWLAYSHTDDRGVTIYLKKTDGSEPEALLLQEKDYDLWPYSFTPDSKQVLYGREDKTTSNEDLWLVPVDGQGQPSSLFETPFDEWPGRFSPDSRWLAFDSDETGRQEIFVIPFGGGRRKVAGDARWRSLRALERRRSRTVLPRPRRQHHGRARGWPGCHLPGRRPGGTLQDRSALGIRRGLRSRRHQPSVPGAAATEAGSAHLLVRELAGGAGPTLGRWSPTITPGAWPSNW